MISSIKNQLTGNHSLLFTCFYLLFIISCGSDDQVDPDTPNLPDRDGEALSFNEVVALGKDFGDFTLLKDKVTLGDPMAFVGQSVNEEGITEKFDCASQKVRLRNGVGVFRSLRPNVEEVFPGNLIQGQSLLESNLADIPLERAEGNFKLTLKEEVSSQLINVSEMAGSQVKEAISQALSGEVTSTNQYDLEIIDIYHQDQLAVELGIRPEIFKAQSATDLAISVDNLYQRALIKLEQVMYSTEYELPENIESLFQNNVTPKDLKQFIDADNPAGYISSITYGRAFFVLIETTSSRAELNSAIEDGFSDFDEEGNGLIQESAFNSLTDFKIKAIGFGGASEGFDLKGETNLNELADKVSKVVSLETAQPLSYEIRSLKNPEQVVGANLEIEYLVTECDPVGFLPDRGYENLVDIFGEDDYIGAAFNLVGSTIVVYNSTGKKYAVYHVGSAKVLGLYDHNDPSGPHGLSDLNSVEAAFQPGNDGVISLFEKNTEAVQEFHISTELEDGVLPEGAVGFYISGAVTNVRNYFQANSFFAFDNQGISAAVRLPANIGSRSSLLFSEDGSIFLRTRTVSTDGSFVHDPAQVNDDFPGGDTGDLFAEVGAAVLVKREEGDEIMFINKSGDKMLIWKGERQENGENIISISEKDIKGAFSSVRLMH